MRRYRNLKEINTDLRLMELKIHLEKEKVNLGVAQLKKQTQPQALVKGLVTTGLKQISVIGLLRGLFKRKSRRKRRP